MKKIKRICVINSAYSLFLYLLLSKTEEIDSTFFFWSDGIPDKVKAKFKDNSYYFTPLTNKLKKPIYLFYLYHYKIKRMFPFLSNHELTYWGHDHLYFSSSIIRNKDFSLIEDGMSNYYPIQLNRQYSKIRVKLFGKLNTIKGYYGIEETCKKIFLTGLCNTEILNNKKIEIINIKKLWHNSDKEKKEKIMLLFSLNEEKVSQFKMTDTVLITQPFSEDDILTKEEKLEIYSKLIKTIGTKNLTIKPHPREKTEYSVEFPNANVCDKDIPIELLFLLGINIKAVYTICSTAAFNMPNHVKVHFLGSQVHEKVRLKFPHLTSKETDPILENK